MNQRYRTLPPLALAATLLCQTAWSQSAPAPDEPAAPSPSAPMAIPGPAAPPPAEASDSEEPPGPAVVSEPRHQQEGLIGGNLILLGPVGNYGVSIGYQLSSLVELQLGGTGQSVSVAQTDGDVRATGDISVTTPFLRARIWPGSRHNFIAEGGLAVMHYNLTATAQDTQNNSITYTRGGNLPIAFAGGGYGLRTDAGFRLGVLMGWMQYIGKADASTLTTTGNFNPADRASSQARLDDTSDQLGQSRLYLELSAGWMF